jgi:hypothetical protein
MAFITFQPNDYFNTKLFTGTGSSNAVTGVGFRPDWLWIKNRSTTSSHIVQDVVRGATKQVYPDLNNAEVTGSDGVSSFDSDGFTVGTGASFNGNGNNIVAWNWLAGGSQGSSNTDGSINTTYTSANTTSGFSISTYTGTGSNATIGHGLGVAPKVVLVKRTNTTGNWTMYHIGSGATKYLYLNQTAAEASASSIWNDTAPTSSVFSVGTDGEVNASGSTYVAYCFASVKGFSKFGVYYGDASADGPFIYTGFKPGLIILKRAGNAGNNWNMIDSKRSPSNDVDKILFPSSTDAEVTTTVADINSTGFKIRLTSSGWNHNQDKFIYMAFAEEPLVSSNNVPATAR